MSKPTGDTSYVKGTTDQQLINVTIGDALEATCRQAGLRDAVVFPEENRRLTFTQLKREVDRMASGLLAIGLSTGDHVMLWGANHADLVIAVYACAKVGLVYSNLNHNYAGDIVHQHLKTANSKALICFPTVKSGHCYEVLRKIIPELKDSAVGHLGCKSLPKLSHIITAEEEFSYGGCYKLSYVCKFGSTPDKHTIMAPVAANVRPEDVASIQFTSATTGEAKAVQLSHYQLVNAAKVAGHRLYLDQQGESLCCPMPVFRGPVQCLAVLSTAVLGTKVVYPAPGPLPSMIFQAIQDEKCTCLVSNPIALHLMLRMPALKKYKIDSLTSVCLMFDHLPSELIPAMQKCTSVGDVTIGLALTESGCMPMMFPMNGKPDKLHRTVGQVAAHYEIKIVDFNGSIAKLGQPGEVLVKPIGNSKFLDYYNSKDPKAVDKDGWIRSGDVGIMDSDGYVTLMGHCNDVIFYRKKPVLPVPIERHLSTYSSVIGAQVVGVKDAECGEKICAFIVLKEKEGLQEDKIRRDLIEMCKEEKLNEPHYIVFVKDFPRTVAKKVQKFKLKAMAPGLIAKK